MTYNDAATCPPEPAPKPTTHIVMQSCSCCGVTFNAPNAYPPPGWVWRGSTLLCGDCQMLDSKAAAVMVRVVPHPMQAEFDRIMATPRFQFAVRGDHCTVSYQAAPTLNPDGTMNTPMRFPVLRTSELLEREDAAALAARAAQLLELDYLANATMRDAA